MFNPQKDYGGIASYQMDKSQYMEDKLHMSDLERVEADRLNGSVLTRRVKNESCYMEDAADSWMENIDELNLASEVQTPSYPEPKPFRIHYPLTASGNDWVISKWNGHSYEHAQMTADDLLKLDLSDKDLARLAFFGKERTETKKKKHGFFGWF